MISYVANLEGKGVKLVSKITKGFPKPSSPFGPNFSKLIIPSIIVGVIGFLEHITIGTKLAELSGYTLDPSQV